YCCDGTLPSLFPTSVLDVPACKGTRGRAESAGGSELNHKLSTDLCVGPPGHADVQALVAAPLAGARSLSASSRGTPRARLRSVLVGDVCSSAPACEGSRADTGALRDAPFGRSR